MDKSFPLIKRFTFFLILLTTLISGCDDEYSNEVMLSKKKMVDVLIDIHLAQAQVDNARLQSFDSSQVLFYKLQANIFIKHKVDSATYFKSYEYYLENIKQLDKIYEAVIDSLSYRETLVNTLKMTTIPQTPEQLAIIDKIKQSPLYQNDTLVIFTNGKIISSNKNIQTIIEQMYNIPSNMEHIKKEVYNQSLPEPYVVYLKAIEHYRSQFKQ